MISGFNTLEVKMARIERDSLGEVEVPEGAYYGSFTVRAKENFNLSGAGVPNDLVKALGEIKVAAARVNREGGYLDNERAEAIVSAAKELVEGQFADQFPLDMVQAGAGTPIHMNVNEVIANRATELLGGKRGEYLVHPNDHVNMGQSSNNVIPTALRLVLIRLAGRLVSELTNLGEALLSKSSEFGGIVKVGRTHYQDAVPVTLGQEFSAYANLVEKIGKDLKNTTGKLGEVGLGGNAIGTGINTSPGFRESLVAELARVAGEDLKPAENNISMTQSMRPFLMLSGSMREAATELIKIVDDLTFMSSGPKAGVNEIDLPEVEPGSSIMPGKVNPSILEAVKMSLLQILGYDHTVSLASGEGHLELNVMTPIIGKNMIESLNLFRSAVKSLRQKCVEGITANKDVIARQFDESTAVATALSPYIGYDRVAKLVKMSLEEDRNFKELIRGRGWLTKDELDNLLAPERLTSPRGIDEQLKERVTKRLEK